MSSLLANSLAMKEEKSESTTGEGTYFEHIWV